MSGRLIPVGQFKLHDEIVASGYLYKSDDAEQDTNIINDLFDDGYQLFIERRITRADRFDFKITLKSKECEDIAYCQGNNSKLTLLQAMSCLYPLRYP